MKSRKPISVSRIMSLEVYGDGDDGDYGFTQERVDEIVAEETAALRAQIETLTRDLATERERFIMHTAEVSAWLSALADIFGIKAENVREACSMIYDAAKSLRKDGP